MCSPQGVNVGDVKEKERHVVALFIIPHRLMKLLFLVRLGYSCLVKLLALWSMRYPRRGRLQRLRQ